MELYPRASGSCQQDKKLRDFRRFCEKFYRYKKKQTWRRCASFSDSTLPQTAICHQLIAWKMFVLNIVKKHSYCSTTDQFLWSGIENNMVITMRRDSSFIQVIITYPHAVFVSMYSPFIIEFISSFFLFPTPKSVENESEKWIGSCPLLKGSVNPMCYRANLT